MQPHTVADLIRAIYLALLLHGHLTPLILGHIIFILLVLTEIDAYR